MPPQASWAPRPAAPTASKKSFLLGGVGVAAAAAIGYFLVAGPSTGNLAVSVSGPGGKAIEGVVVLVDGVEACHGSPCRVEGLSKGSHEVTARAPGHDDASPRLASIKAGEDEVLNLELASRTAGTGIDVDVRAPGLTLSLDGKDLGPLPRKVMDLLPGDHEIVLGGNKLFKPFKQTVTLEAGKVLDFEPALTLDQGQLTITVGEGASGAKILLEGGGKTFALHKKKLPLTINIPADQSFTLSASRDGFEDFKQDVRFSVEEPQKTIEVNLTPKAGYTPPPVVETPKSSPPSSSSSTSSAASRPRPSASAAPAAGQGTLNINSIPVSNVILDGRPIGSTPKLGVKVSAGAHTVVFVHPQHGRKITSVQVPAGGTGTAAVRFP